MSLERFIAGRYLRSKRAFGFVTLISSISIIGITIGVAALVVVLSVFNGFNTLVTSLLVSFDPHLRIESRERAPLASYDSLLRSLTREEAVVGSSPFVQGKAIIIRQGQTRVVTVKGIEGETVTAVSGLQEKMVLGEMSLKATDGNTIVLGINLADRLGVVVGDTIAIVSPSSATSPMAQFGLPVIRRFRVAGMYETNNKEYDAFYSFVSIRSAQSLFQVGDRIDGVEVRFTSLDRSGGVQRWLRTDWGAQYRVLTWYDLHRELYTVMQIERWAAYVILMLIVAVASFNLLGSLTMTVIEKTRDIGVLKAMGAPTAVIRRIFLFQGLYVGVIGTVLGLLLGLVIVWAQQTFHLFPLDSTVYIISAIPVEVRWYDLVVIGLASVGLALLAARSPARRAADLIPVEAIRWE